MSDRANGRVLALDVLRGIAVLLVMARHAGVHPWESNEPLWAATALANRVGWIGVDLFFVLSGFLVSGLVFREHARTGSFLPLRFLARRGLKIYPAFYAFLAVGLASRWLAGAPVPIAAALSEALFVQNYWLALFGHTWSLAVEEHFYVVIAVALGIMSRRGGGDSRAAFRAIVPLFVVVGVSCLAMRCVVAARMPYTQMTHHFPTHLRVDSLLFGVLLSYLNATCTEALVAFVRAHRTKLVVLAAALLAPVVALPPQHPLMHSIGFTAVYLGCGAIVLVAVHADIAELGAIRRGLAFVGFHSYSIYLWHLVAQGKAARLIGGTETVSRFVVFLVAYTLAAVVLGVVAARIIEIPTLKLRDRLVPSRANGPVTGEGREAEPPPPS